MRVPFEREVLAARVAGGLRAARLRASEALLGSLVANIPGAVYRRASDEHWTMEWLSDEIEAISGYPADDFVNSAVRTFVSVIHPVDLRIALPPERLAGSVEATIYFTVCEALTNVAKYARAGRAWVRVERCDGHMAVEVGDDGAGGADVAAGSGLQGLCDRVAAVSGTLDVESRVGAGTVLRARMPIASPL